MTVYAVFCVCRVDLHVICDDELTVYLTTTMLAAAPTTADQICLITNDLLPCKRLLDIAKCRASRICSADTHPLLRPTTVTIASCIVIMQAQICPSSMQHSRLLLLTLCEDYI